MGLNLQKERRRLDLADCLRMLTRNTQAKGLDPRAAHQLWILCCSRWARQTAGEVAQGGFHRASVSENSPQRLAILFFFPVTKVCPCEESM